MAQTKRRSEPTHPTVWVGLALALAGLVVALYAYTGPRVYDITFFFVAILGGVLALGGILAAAWGRAIGQARRQRSRRLAVAAGASAGVQTKADKESAADSDKALPTVAAPAGKKGLLARLKPGSGKPEDKGGAGRTSDPPGKAVFAFKRRNAETDEQAATSGPTSSEGSSSQPRKERVTLQCPECSTSFSQEGVRPFRVACPNCAFSAEV